MVESFKRCCRHPTRVVLTLVLIVFLTWTVSKTSSFDGYLSVDDASHAPAKSPWCRTTFDDDYLNAFLETSAQYCDDESGASLTCFTHTIDPKGIRHDSFCIGSPATPRIEHPKFQLRCKLNTAPTDSRGSPVPPLNSFPTYWYETGPSYLFHNFIEITDHPEPKRAPVFDVNLPTIILVKREIANFNLWHNLLEVMSVSHSLDIISQSSIFLDMWAKPIRDNLNILLLDDSEDGPYHDVWHAISPKPVLRLTDLPHLLPSNIIIPIPGGANPFWQGDWVDLGCGRSSLLSTFSNRILGHYNLTNPTVSTSTKPLTVTIIDRTTKRRLIDQDGHISAVKAALPEHKIQLIDLAALPLREQLVAIRQTDVLVGVHGAGLTHGIFLPPTSAIVEFMPHSLDHRGFSNMAKMLGLAYRDAKTLQSVNGAQGTGDWQQDDVEVDAEVYVQAIRNATLDVEKARAKTRSRFDALVDIWNRI